MAIPDSWSETAFVSIAIKSGSWQTFQALTETIDVDMGEKAVEWVPDIAGGRISKFTPQAETTVTLEAYPIEAGTAATTATAGTGFFDLMYANTTTTQPQSITSSRDRLNVKIVLLWTTVSGTTTATESLATATTDAALRMQFAEGYVTSIKPSFTDGIVKFTIEAKFPPFNKSGTSTQTFESVSATTAGMSSVGAYT
jgi:hypothetical protein